MWKLRFTVILTDLQSATKSEKSPGSAGALQHTAYSCYLINVMEIFLNTSDASVTMKNSNSTYNQINKEQWAISYREWNRHRGIAKKRGQKKKSLSESEENSPLCCFKWLSVQKEVSKRQQRSGLGELWVSIKISVLTWGLKRQKKKKHRLHQQATMNHCQCVSKQAFCTIEGGAQICLIL